jgi:hypothetical protein
MRRSLSRVRAALARRERTWGEPRSRNGASSFHLVWELPQVPLNEAEATLEILVPPRVQRLYFWALQVSFASDRRLQGGAHLGLQWNPAFPGNTAANWGGYGTGGGGTQILEGSASPLPGVRNDPNTRDFDWQFGRRYRLHIAPSPEIPAEGHAWRGTITDVESGDAVVVRDLYSGGSYLLSPMVWSEVFARCEQPGVVVRWSDLRVIAADGSEIVPQRVRVNYQSRTDGGCDNTSVSVDELGLLQITTVERRVPQGAILPVPGG